LTVEYSVVHGTTIASLVDGLNKEASSGFHVDKFEVVIDNEGRTQFYAVMIKDKA
jgi:hypothetical protein